MRGGGGVSGENARARQATHCLERRQHQERGSDRHGWIGTGRNQDGEDRQLTAQESAGVGQRGATGQLVLRGQQRRLARLHGSQHAALGTEGTHLAQPGQRVQRGYAQGSCGVGQYGSRSCGHAGAEPWQCERGDGEQPADHQGQ